MKVLRGSWRYLEVLGGVVSLSQTIFNKAADDRGLTDTQIRRAQSDLLFKIFG